MYRIGDFSKITSLTIKTLRYYDEQDILTPFYRGENGYRYYNENDFKTAQLIVLLRDMDFRIAEIKDVLTNYEDDSDLSYFLADKKKMIEKRVSDDQKLIKRMECFIEPEKISRKQNHIIGIKNVAPTKVASKRFTGAYHETGAYQEEILQAIKGESKGAPFNCYYTSGYSDATDIEVCIPTDKYVNIDGIRTKELPGIKAICTVHMGGYDCLNYAYKAVLDYANNNNIKYSLPTREIYHKGPGILFMGNPNRYVTEIMFPCNV